MKKIFIIITATCAASLMFSRCKKVLDKQDISSFTASQVYNDSSTTKLSVDYLYSQNQPGWFGANGGTISNQVSNLTEEFASSNVFVLGTLTTESVTDIGTANASNNAYGKIRLLNQFILDVTNGSMDPAMKKRFISQALFWRAYRYFELIKLYGGVPLILTPLPEVGPEARAAALLPRNKTSEVYAQVVNDLDTCIKYLPAKWPQAADYGRITSAAAASMLSRVTLTYASPQFNRNNADPTRWQAAYDAATLALSLCAKGGFSLFPKFDYTMWTTERNSESILVTEYNTSATDNGANNNSYPNSTIPKGVGGNATGNQPTWDMARAFLMKDGKDTLTSVYPYSPQTFYKNRDPRFDATIAYNGGIWPVLGNNNYRVWTYFYYNSKTASTTVTTEALGASSTGLYLKKAIDPSLTATTLSAGTGVGTDWIEIRYAEVLLNQAEAAVELGRTGTNQEAYTNIIAIRKRAGIDANANNFYGLPTTPLAHDPFIDVIMKERQTEFAYEGKRYWDLRRRNLLESTFNAPNGIKKRMAVIVTLNNTSLGTDYIATTRDGSAATSLDAVYANFKVTTKYLDTNPFNYGVNQYFFAIPTASITNNVNLLQNNTWPNGTFDPLK